VNHPTPAIVASAAARRIPRTALLLFCAAYVLSGFLGRDAWKSADATAFGYMLELATGTSQWLRPTLLGASPDSPALLPYWLGAWTIEMAPSWLALDFAVRIPFIALLALALVATWHACNYLARSPQAQPVAFAFGGEALPHDYARAMGDGGLLAFIACLGLAQLSHETTPALAQLSFSALFFFAMAALPYRRTAAAIAGTLGLLGLALSGAPFMALVFGLGGAFIHSLDRSANDKPRRIALETAVIVLGTGAIAALAQQLGLLRWKIQLPHALWVDWNGYAQLLIWFTWPAWPLALWTAWRWRRQIANRDISRHLALPGWFLLVTLAATLSTGASDRTLLIGMPALAALATFALPTLKRQVSALIDWFTLLFFSGCGLTIWVVWIAMQTGYPTQPAANVERLAPGFEASFSVIAFGIAIAATSAWAWLVKWRVGRHRTAIWKSLVLPAAGSGLCWLLLMTLWMPLLNYAQGYVPLVKRLVVQLDEPGCVHTHQLSQGQVAAFQFYGKLQLSPLSNTVVCPWLLVEPTPDMTAPATLDTTHWEQTALLSHPVDRGETVLVFKRKK
jgi:4-amino-4-deoxy-L-arabinose transferase-like glycosyltransferase